MKSKLTLIHNVTGEPLKVGEWYPDFRGDKFKLIDMSEPRNACSTGRVHVEDKQGTKSSYYPGVINATWKEMYLVEGEEDSLLLTIKSLGNEETDEDPEVIRMLIPKSLFGADEGRMEREALREAFLNAARPFFKYLAREATFSDEAPKEKETKK